MKKITLSLTIDNANLVLKALGKLPHEQVNVLIPEIVNQANEQLKEPEPNKEEPK